MTDTTQIAAALPSYEIGDELGRGAFGRVLAGRHRRLGRRVAIKQLHGAVAADEAHSARFLREAQVLASLGHPHVVQVYDYVEVDGMRLLVMEHLGGGSLKQRVERSPLDHQTACTAVMASCAGLHYAHTKGVLHRDIKPENLMFDETGTLKVTDFGLARMTTEQSGGPTEQIMGTPVYMAPEQAGAGEIGPPTDVYAAGTMLYELLSGTYPHDAEGGVLAIIYRHLNEDPIPIERVAPALHPALRPVVMHALERDPDRRFATTEDFAIAVGAAAWEAWGADWAREAEIPIRATGTVLAATENPPPPAWRQRLLEERGPTLTVPVVPPLPAPPVVPPVVGGPAAVPLTAPTAFPPAPPPAGPASAVPGVPGLPGPSLPPVNPGGRSHGRRWGVLLTGLGSTIVVALVLAAIVVSSRDSDDPPPAETVPRVEEREAAWTFDTDDKVFASPTADGDQVIVGSDDGNLYALAADDGTERWRYAVGEPIRSSAAVDDGLAVVGGFDGNIHAVDNTTGEGRWEYEAGYQIVSSPTIVSGTVYVGADRLLALDIGDGTERWAFAPGEAIVSSPTVAGDMVFVGSNDGNLYAVDIATGAERWRFATGDQVTSSPVAADGIVYVGSRDGNVYAIDAATGGERWRVDTEGPVNSSPTVTDGTLYVGTAASALVALDAAEGTERWLFETRGAVDSSPAVADDLVVVGSNDEYVHAVEALTGQERWLVRTDSAVLSSPTVVDDMVVVGSDDGNVYGIGL